MVAAILISALLGFLLGFLWYSPKVFGDAWLQAIGKTEKGIEPTIARHAISIIGWLAAAFVYAIIISQSIAIRGVQDYMFLSIALWGAFMLPAKATAMFQGNFNTKLIWIDGMYYLVGYLIMALVFGLFA